jgi:hypothetical protein
LENADRDLCGHNNLYAVEGSYTKLNADMKMIKKGRRDEGVGGDDYMDTSDKENDGINDVSVRSWSFFSSAVLTTLGVNVKHYYTS